MQELSTDTRKGTQCSNGSKLSLSERTYLSLNEAYRYTCNTLSTALGLSRMSKVCEQLSILEVLQTGV